MKDTPVLIVDSDPVERSKCASVVSSAGYRVLQAAAYAEGREILDEHGGRVVVLSEFRAGGEAGIDFLDRYLGIYPFLTLTFLSSSAPPESVIQALKKGAYDFLQKPVSPDILLHSVGRSVQKLDLLLEAEDREREVQKLLERSREDLKNAKTLSSFKGFMISMASHDFRSIITVLDNYMRFIGERCKGCGLSDSGGMLKQATRTISRLRTMTNTLFDYEAAETGKIRLNIQPFTLYETLRECVEFYRPYAEQKDIRLLMDGGPTTMAVLGDRDKIMEILDNLLYNALKFTPSRGTIHLSMEKTGDSATVCVSDSGVGMPKKKLQKIFDRENMVATLDAQARLGLGLTICKRLVEEQNGQIRIDSKLGKGTQVYFSLPAA